MFNDIELKYYPYSEEKLYTYVYNKLSNKTKFEEKNFHTLFNHIEVQLSCQENNMDKMDILRSFVAHYQFDSDYKDGYSNYYFYYYNNQEEYKAVEDNNTSREVYLTSNASCVDND